MSAYQLGMITGFIVVFIIIMFLASRWMRGGEKRLQYDERQQILRGRGYMYGFYAIIIALFLYAWMIQFGINMPVEHIVVCYLIMFGGVMVDIGYCIWQGAYFSMNEKQNRVLIVFFFIGAFNMFVGIRNIINGSSITNGKLNSNCVNLFCGILFVFIFLISFLRKFISFKEDGEEE